MGTMEDSAAGRHGSAPPKLALLLADDTNVKVHEKMTRKFQQRGINVYWDITSKGVMALELLIKGVAQSLGALATLLGDWGLSLASHTVAHSCQ